MPRPSRHRHATVHAEDPASVAPERRWKATMSAVVMGGVSDDLRNADPLVDAMCVQSSKNAGPLRHDATARSKAAVASIDHMLADGKSTDAGDLRWLLRHVPAADRVPVLDRIMSVVGHGAGFGPARDAAAWLTDGSRPTTIAATRAMADHLMGRGKHDEDAIPSGEITAAMTRIAADPVVAAAMCIGDARGDEAMAAGVAARTSAASDERVRAELAAMLESDARGRKSDAWNTARVAVTAGIPIGVMHAMGLHVDEVVVRDIRSAHGDHRLDAWLRGNAKGMTTEETGVVRAAIDETLKEACRKFLFIATLEMNNVDAVVSRAANTTAALVDGGADATVPLERLRAVATTIDLDATNWVYEGELDRILPDVGDARKAVRMAMPGIEAAIANGCIPWDRIAHGSTPAVHRRLEKFLRDEPRHAGHIAMQAIPYLQTPGHIGRLAGHIMRLAADTTLSHHVLNHPMEDPKATHYATKRPMDPIAAPVPS